MFMLFRTADLQVRGPEDYERAGRPARRQDGRIRLITRYTLFRQ
jgi:hypothetical protein